ncbi:HtaA domain-containing protein [Solirubrobacter phytolaccae]|uniref:HtaA domain-containing protein n=1 Tax=Solirubrobacter phytolaccae TaxID=1404360 RepID=A0A9X3N667_9ACTN|nr:HtaA domain-containing protein [Solirubrobacter phytolaccae]MDA0180359.1 HtaA domain-containing protein [Solirubrobacter phytolaccae]
MTKKSLGRRLLAPVALFCALLPAATASAQEPVPITSGAGADWGVKASFRSYAVGPIAHGAIAVEDGASVNPDGTYHFPIKGGAYDPLTGATVVQLSGAVHFTGHAGQLDLKISDPRVEVTADGSSLYANVASKTSLEATEITQFPNVRVSDIDLTDKTPAIADGKTAWPALPQALTAAGAPAFAGFYTSGTALDPVSFGYDGPGGRPQIESWSQPGAPQFDKVVTGTLGNGTGALAFDPERDRVWSSSYDGLSLTALRESDLSSIAAVKWTVADAFHPRNVAVDRTTGDAYTVDASVQRVKETGGVFAVDTTFSSPFGSGASNALDSTPDGTIWTVKDDQLSRFKDGVRTAYTLPQSYDNLAVLDDGSIFVYAQFSARSVGRVTLGDGTASVTDLPGTDGVTAPGFTADGTLYFVEQDYSEYPKVTRRLWSVKRSGGGYEKTQVPGIATGIGGSFITVAGDGSTIYVANEALTGLSVIRDGKLVDTIAPDGTLADLETSPDGDVYAVWRSGRIARLGQVGTTPTFTATPQDVVVEPGAAATFTADATGDAAPALKWQTRAPGTTRWADAGTGSSFVLANPVSNTRVRAIATNAVGAIASGAVSVTVKAPVQEDPPAGDGGTTPPPVANPAPVPTPIAAPAPTRAPTWSAPKSAKVSTKRQASVLSLTCGSAACAITAPKTVKVKIGGRTYTLTVTAPKSLAAGKKGTVRVKLTAAAYRALRGRKATAKVKVVLTAGGQKTTRTLSVSLKR